MVNYPLKNKFNSLCSCMVFVAMGLVSSVAYAEDLQHAPQVALPATFEFLPAIKVASERLFLGRVASCVGYPKLCEESYAVDLGQGPAPGKTITLSKRWLENQLRSEWPGANITVKAPESVKIEGAFEKIDSTAVLEILRPAINAKFEDNENLRISVENVQMSSGVKIRPGNFTLRFPLIEQTKSESLDWILKHYNGSQRLEVESVSDVNGEDVIKFSVMAKLSIERMLPVASRNLLRGEIVKKKDFQTQWVEVRNGRKGQVDSVRDLVGRRMKSNVNVGQTVNIHQVEIPEVVRKGQFVKLIMKTAGLQVTGQVRALGNGGYGQVIDAMYQKTSKRLRVRIVDSSTVEYVY